MDERRAQLEAEVAQSEQALQEAVQDLGFGLRHLLDRPHDVLQRPASWVLLGAGLAVLLWLRRR